MKVRQLKTVTKGLVTAMAFSAILLGCDDSKSGNNSTTGDETVTDTSSTGTTTATTPVKRKGKISAKINADDPAVKVEKDKLGFYTRTDVAPEYTGGQSAIEDYITNNIVYPQDAIDNNVEGVVNVQFVVDENGNISNVGTVGPKIGYGLEEEAVKVVSQMPKWTPGLVKGKKVKTWRTLPINYRLES